MKPEYVLGNWKSNMTVSEAINWVEVYSKHENDLPSNITIIVCPAYHHLSVFLAKKLSLSLGVQDVSPFPSGAYTGEISAAMLGNNISYALLGHSERRTHLGETNELIIKKAQMASEAGIKPIICVSNQEEVSYVASHFTAFQQTGMFLHEPLSAIGSGQADSSENANTTARQYKELLDVPVLYGGSVKPENVKGFTNQEFLNGVGVGGASLDPKTFITLIRNASIQVNS